MFEAGRRGGEGGIAARASLLRCDSEPCGFFPLLASRPCHALLQMRVMAEREEEKVIKLINHLCVHWSASHYLSHNFARGLRRSIAD